MHDTVVPAHPGYMLSMSVSCRNGAAALCKTVPASGVDSGSVRCAGTRQDEPDPPPRIRVPSVRFCQHLALPRSPPAIFQGMDTGNATGNNKEGETNCYFLE